MITISKETARELIAALNSLRDEKSLDVPTHSINGEEIKSISVLAQMMGVPEPIAINAILEQKDHPLQTEAKIRNVRNSTYWGYPIGTPITEAMRPRGSGSSGVSRTAVTDAARRARQSSKPRSVVRKPAENESLIGARRKRLWRISPRGHFNNAPGGGLDGGGGGAGGGGMGGIGGFGGFGALTGLSFTKGGLPKGARKIGEVNGAFADGTRGKAARYVTKLKDGKSETWLILSRYDTSGKLIKDQTAKIKPGFADKQWASVVRALKPKKKG